MPNVGPFEMVIIFVIVLIVFGPKSLPKIGQALGRGIREFKDAARGLTDMDDEPQRPSQPAATQQVPQTPPTTTAEHTTETNTTENHV